MNPGTSASRRGAALIFSVAALAVLLVLVLGLARLARVERDGAREHQLATRARFAASAGVERALAGLRSDADAGLVDGLAEPWASTEPASTPIESMRRPSFREGDGPAGPYSGRLVTPDEEFVLRVRDGHSRLDLSRLERGRDGAARVLDNLARLVPGLPADLAGRLQAASRPGPDLAWARAAIGDGAWVQLEPYVTAGNWADPAAVDPAAASTDPSRLAPAAVARAPLNVNTAPVDLLVAQLWGIAADVPERGVVAIERPLAASLAGALDRRRRERPFAGRSELEAFLAGRVGKVPGFGRLEFEVVRAGLDPNPRLLDYNPDALAGYVRAGDGEPSLAVVDRSRLVAWTVEACFGSFGRYDVESLGRVLSPRGEVLARALVVVRTTGHRPVRHTTQADFEAARVAATETRTWPESVGERREPTALDGQVILTRGAEPGRGDFEAPAPADFDPVRAPAAGWRTSFDRRALLAGGERIADGILARRPDGEGVAAYRPENVPLEEGALEFWYKPDRGFDDDRPLGLVRSTHALGPDRGVHTLVYLHQGRLRATRTYFEGLGQDLAPIEISRRTIEWYEVVPNTEHVVVGDATFAEVWYEKDHGGRELVHTDGHYDFVPQAGVNFWGASGNWVGPGDPATLFRETRDIDAILGEVSATKSVVRRIGPATSPEVIRGQIAACLLMYRRTRNMGYLRTAQALYASLRESHPKFERRPGVAERYRLNSPDAYGLLRPWLVKPVDHYMYFQNGNWIWRGGRFHYEYAGGALSIQALMHGLENVRPAPLYAHFVDRIYPPVDGYTDVSAFRSRTGEPEGWDLRVYLYDRGIYRAETTYNLVRRVRVERETAEFVPYLDVADVTADPRRGGVPDGNPFFSSRVERSIRFDRRAHHWRHVRLEWNDGMDLELFLDGRRATRGEEFPPTRRFASRESTLPAALYLGAVQLDRVTPEAGVDTPAIPGHAVRLPAGGTVEHLLVEAETPGAAARPEAFRSDGRAAFTGRFRTGTTRPTAIGWTAPTPPGWRLVWKAGASADPSRMVELEPDGDGWASLDDPRLAGSGELHYRVEFVRDGGPDAGDLAPWLDEVTLVAAGPIRIASWHWIP